MLAWLLAAAAILAPSVSASAESDPDNPVFAFSAASLPGDVTINSDSATEIRVPGGQGAFVWRISAASATVNWTKDRWLEVGRPTNLSEPLGSTRLESTAGETELRAVVLESMPTRAGANLFVTSHKFGDFAMHGVLQDGRLQHTSVGSRIGGAVGDYAPMEVEYDVVEESIDGNAKGGRIWAQGNMTLLVWETDVLVTAPEGRQTFRSGDWVNGIGPAPTKEPHAARERNYQLLRIDVVDGSLEIHAEGRELGWMARNATAAGNQTVVFEDASEAPDPSTNGTGREGPRVMESGRYWIEIWPATGDPATLKARWLADTVGAQDSTGFGEADDRGARPAATWPAGSGSAVWMLPTLAALAFMAGILVLRGRRHVSVDDVEWALLSGRARKARRLGARLVRRRRTDADAIFLYGAALLARRKHSTVLRTLEPLATALPRPRRRGIAYVLMSAAAARGDLKKARHWAVEAAHDPGLRRRMEDDGVFRRLGITQPVVAGYA